MHNSYFLLRALAAELQPELEGGIITSCFSQNRDELILVIEKPGIIKYIRALLLPTFSCLSFPATFHRTRKNSIDLFAPLIGQRIERIEAIENDRSMFLQFPEGTMLIFKMHGNRSNAILYRPGLPNEIFKKQLKDDNFITPDALTRKIEYTRHAFTVNAHRLQEYFVTLGKPVWNYLQRDNFSGKSVDEQWACLKNIFDQFERPKFYLIRDQQGVRISLLNEPVVEHIFEHASEALTAFCKAWLRDDVFGREKSRWIRYIRQQTDRLQAACQKISARLNELETDHRFKQQADLIMAYLHTIPPGSSEVLLPDFQTGQPLQIKLKPDLSPQKNAEILYQKWRNRNSEKEEHRKLLTSRQEELSRLEKLLKAMEGITSLKALQQLTSGLSVHPVHAEKGAQRLPYREQSFMGFQIRIGRSARDNDELIMKYAHKDDLWLHVRDASGSHVIIRHKPGQPIPQPVVERAAQLAAWYSTRKTESLCPVSVTERKYVRKRKGDPPGAVVADREKVVLVEPRP